jgi:cobyrinic acid a,c-diamide synthase
VARAASVPRLVIAAPGSGSGKTTVAVALIAALRARGCKVAPFKCGPDYLDPSYHGRAAGVTSHNLDSWMMGRQAVAETFLHAAADADIAIIEGMMGLFDGTTPSSDEGSTAEIAKWLGAPVLLVVDASGMARTIGAVAAGFSRFDTALDMAGLICNRVGSRGHIELLRTASTEVPVLGGLPQTPEAAFPERHLGLLTADENNVPSARLEAWGKLAAEWFDLDAIIGIARHASAIQLDSLPKEHAGRSLRTRCRVGIAWDRAFHFYYDYNLAMLERLGAELVRFSPAHDDLLPTVDGLYFGGGYPESVARELSANHAMRVAVREFAISGRPIYAECGGLMYLVERIRLTNGDGFDMAGVLPGEARMNQRLQALGYVEVETRADSIIGSRGTRFRGHQFRYSTLEPPPDNIDRLYRIVPRWGSATFDEGYRSGNIVASYVHAHWASNPAIPGYFIEACARG